MLTTKAFAAGGLLVLLAGAAGSSPAFAEGSAGTVCDAYSSMQGLCQAGSVTVEVTTPGAENAIKLTNDGNGSAPQCLSQGTPVPCDSPAGWWSAERGCYVKLSNHSVNGDPVYDALAAGKTTATGRVYDCTVPGQGATRFWADNPPPVANRALVLQVAAKAARTLQLRGIDIGMTPPTKEARADSVGLVGAPTWLWVRNPSPQTWGIASGTASDQGITVTVTAKPAQVTWDLGDGTPPVVCNNPGVPWTSAAGVTPSPACGRASGYQQSGEYPVQATTRWGIDYTSNVGFTGSMTMDVTAKNTVVIAEAQVLNR